MHHAPRTQITLLLSRLVGTPDTTMSTLSVIHIEELVQGSKLTNLGQSKEKVKERKSRACSCGARERGAM